MIQKKAESEGWLFKDDDQNAWLSLAEDGIKAEPYLSDFCYTAA
jgi:hypothetical protein